MIETTIFVHYPMVFPTDDITKGLAEFKKRKFGMVVACAAGQGTAKMSWKKITECVVQQYDTTDVLTIKSFFKWVSASVGAGSMKVEDTGADVGGMVNFHLLHQSKHHG